MTFLKLEKAVGMEATVQCFGKCAETLSFREFDEKIVYLEGQRERVTDLFI